MFVVCWCVGLNAWVIGCVYVCVCVLGVCLLATCEFVVLVVFVGCVLCVWCVCGCGFSHCACFKLLLHTILTCHIDIYMGFPVCM